jgi:transcription initiation factor TFIIIB Brf1 subunit/transcription initiation factor TFIIB
MKKCPNCNSTRITKTDKSFHCKKCGFTNKKIIVLTDIASETGNSDGLTNGETQMGLLTQK